MRKRWPIVALTALSLSLPTLADARIGSGRRSMGTRGARAYTMPRQTPPLRGSRPAYTARRDAGSSPFLRGMAGGLAGGFIGSMLFRNSGYAGGYAGPYAPGYGQGGYGAFGGLGLFDLLVLGGIGYFLLRRLRPRRARAWSGPRFTGSHEPHPFFQVTRDAPLELEPIERLAARVPGFDPDRFRESRIQDFLRMHPARSRGGDIVVRDARVIEAWEEGDTLHATVAFDASGTGPSRVEELWTFSLPAGARDWTLSSMQVDDGTGMREASR